MNKPQQNPEAFGWYDSIFGEGGEMQNSRVSALLSRAIEVANED